VTTPPYLFHVGDAGRGARIVLCAIHTVMQMHAPAITVEAHGDDVTPLACGPSASPSCRKKLSPEPGARLVRDGHELPWLKAALRIPSTP
jgi:hypothetical protein